MKEFKNYFKSREEVEKYFGDEVFKFDFMSDNTMYFKTLKPAFVAEQLVTFQIAFYFEKCQDFFSYSNFVHYLDKFQLAKVICISEETAKRETMFFRQYKSSLDE
jgi:hypothetical protein